VGPYSIYIIAGAFSDHRRGRRLARLPVPGSQEGSRGGHRFDKAVELSEQNKHAEAEAAFAELAKNGPSGYRALARLRVAGQAANRDTQEAAKMFDDHRRRWQRRRQAAGARQNPGL